MTQDRQGHTERQQPAGQARQAGPRARYPQELRVRAVPMVEAMVALVLVDHYLRQRGQCGV